MNIVMVFHAPPFPPDIGPSRRHYHVLTETMKRHDVTVLSLGTNADRTLLLEHTGLDPRGVHFAPGDRTRTRKALRSAAYLATGRSDFRRLRVAALQRLMDRAVDAASFDVAYFSTVMLGCYRLPKRMPLIGDTHNVEHDNLARAARTAPERWRRAHFRAQAALTRREERAHVKRFDIVCATSSRDRDVLRRFAPGAEVAVVPNGIDLEKYSPRYDAQRRDGLLLFTGLMSYYPNVHAVLRLVRGILPLVRERVPHARVVVAGADPPASIRALAGEAVEITGRVADIRPCYAQAHALVVPLAIGGGTRVKVLEALAIGVPVVSTTVGCEGLDVIDGESVLIADSDAAIANAVVRLLESPTLAASLVRGGTVVAHRYDWRRIGGVLDDVIRAAAAQRPSMTLEPHRGTCSAH
jgi:glycosyltransferase involved in cell wall biosynthesis